MGYVESLDDPVGWGNKLSQANLAENKAILSELRELKKCHIIYWIRKIFANVATAEGGSK